MRKEQQATKYISGLNYSIQECVILHDVFSIDEAHNKALKIERLQSRAPPFRRPVPIEESASGTRVQLSSTTVDRPPARQSTNAPVSAPATTIAAAAKSKENSYAKAETGKYYRSEELGHKSNECLKGNKSI